MHDVFFWLAERGCVITVLNKHCLAISVWFNAVDEMIAPSSFDQPGQVVRRPPSPIRKDTEEEGLPVSVLFFFLLLATLSGCRSLGQQTAKFHPWWNCIWPLELSIFLRVIKCLVSTSLPSLCPSIDECIP